MRACVRTYLTNHPSTQAPNHPTTQPTNQPTYLPACLPARLHACMPPYLPACLHAYMPALTLPCLHLPYLDLYLLPVTFAFTLPYLYHYFTLPCLLHTCVHTYHPCVRVKDIRVGAYLKLQKNDPIPADMILLACANEDGHLYFL